MAGALENFAGTYSDGDRVLALRQDGYRVLLSLSGSERELRQTAAWRFEDGCGSSYQLSLPMNGTGAVLEVRDRTGKLQRWQRIERGAQ